MGGADMLLVAWGNMPSGKGIYFCALSFFNLKTVRNEELFAFDLVPVYGVTGVFATARL